MNFVVLFSLLFLLGVSQGQFISNEENELAQLESEVGIQSDQGKRRVLRRIARSAFGNLGQQYIPVMEKIIISNCQVNGQEEAADKLQPIFDETKDCFYKKRIYLTPKDEFLAHIEACSRESVEKSKNCLADKQKYFPDLLLSLAQSLITFLYKDFDIIRVDLVHCYPKLNNIAVVNSFKQCIKEAAGRNHTSGLIPSSKAEFCQGFIPTTYCFTNMIKENCDRTPGLAKYREDYIKSHKEPCEEKETA